MKINIDSKVACINRLLQENEVTKPQQSALYCIMGMTTNAQSSAFSFPPQPTFTYHESLSSALAEELTQNQIKTLAEVAIAIDKSAGMRDHKVKLTFQS